MKDKNDIPQEVIDYCIDNHVSVEEGMTAVIDMRLEAVEKNFATLKGEVKETIDKFETKVTAQEIEDVESFLNSLDQQIQD
jgi:phage-related minor tail protein